MNMKADTGASKKARRKGVLLGADRAAEIAQLLKSEGIETLRMVFADAHGILRGKTLTSAAVPRALSKGLRVPSTLLLKDLSHRTVFPVWSKDGDTPMKGAGDVMLVPDPSTICPLPHAPHSMMIHCDVVTLSGDPIPFAARTVLKNAVEQMKVHGLQAVMGLEVEFQIFTVTDPGLDHSETTMPPRAPQTQALNQGHQFLTETRYDAAEDVLDDIRRSAQDMGMPVQSVEVEMGPGQFEFTFEAGDPLTIADMAVAFRTLVREICARRGLLASFMPKPRVPNAAANGWHIHQSVCDGAGLNLLDGDEETLSPAASAWLAGLIEHARASCIATNPTVNSYKRFSAYQLAPNRIGWGIDNRGAMLRAILSPGDSANRIENRVADSSANPYFALAFQILSGLDGIDSKRAAPAPLSDPYDQEAAALPGNLAEAIDAFEASPLYRKRLGDDFVDYLSRLKRAEWERYLATISEWEQDEYFNAF